MCADFVVFGYYVVFSSSGLGSLTGIRTNISGNVRSSSSSPPNELNLTIIRVITQESTGCKINRAKYVLPIREDIRDTYHQSLFITEKSGTYSPSHQQDNVILTLNSPFVKLSQRTTRVTVTKPRTQLVSPQYAMSEYEAEEIVLRVDLWMRGESLDPALTDERVDCEETTLCMEEICVKMGDFTSIP